MGWGALVTGIVATISGIFGAISYGINNEEEKKQLKTQKTQLGEVYTSQSTALKHDYEQNVANASLAYDQTVEKLQNELELESASLAKNKELSENTLLTNFNENKKESNYKADVADEADTFSEWQYAKELNNQLSILQVNQKAQIGNFNQAAVSSGRSEGDALSAAASSGTRSSSMSTAIELDKANNSAQLQLSQDQARQELKGQYSNYLLESSKNNFSLQQSRDNSNYLRNLFEVGGKEYNIYQNSLNTLNEQYTTALNELNTNVSLAKGQAWTTLGQQLRNYETSYNDQKDLLDINYENNKENIQNAIDLRNDFGYNAFNYASQILTGGMAGAEAGNKAYNYFTNKG